MMGHQGGAHDDGLKALSGLLAAITDPKAAAEKLKELEAKAKEVQSWIAQATALKAEADKISQATAEEKKKIEKIHADTLASEARQYEIGNNLARKSNDLAQREQKLAARAGELAELKNALDKRASDLAIAEREHADRVAKDLADLKDKISAETQKSLQENAARVAVVEDRERILSLREADVARDAKVAADAKALWEGKVASLKSIIGK